MKALSWKQPFASLMLHGKIETRTWETKYRGLVLICASKTAYSEAQILSISGEVQTQRSFLTIIDAERKQYLGHAIAVGNLVDCRPMRLCDEDKCFVEYREPWIENQANGKPPKDKMLWCHIYEDVKAIKPFPWTGVQGWKEVSQEIIDSIVYL